MRNSIPFVLLIVLSIIPLVSSSMEIYKCEINGLVAFSDIKCSSHAEKIIVRPESASHSDYSHFNAGSSGMNSHGNNEVGNIYTGPRGGRFYYNSNGNKTYVKHN